MGKTIKQRKALPADVDAQQRRPQRQHKSLVAVNKNSKKTKNGRRQQKQKEESLSQRQQHQSAKNEALRLVLAHAFSSPLTRDHNALSVDGYGKGCPTDRLQFGYAPANAAEAVAFHATIPVKKWIEARRQRGRLSIVKKQKLARPNCEPITSALKLKQHWKKTAQFVAEVRGGGGVECDAADDLLEMLVAKQRII